MAHPCLLCTSVTVWMIEPQGVLSRLSVRPGLRKSRRDSLALSLHCRQHCPLLSSVWRLAILRHICHSFGDTSSFQFSIEAFARFPRQIYFLAFFVLDFIAVFLFDLFTFDLFKFLFYISDLFFDFSSLLFTSLLASIHPYICLPMFSHLTIPFFVPPTLRSTHHPIPGPLMRGALFRLAAARIVLLYSTAADTPRQSLRAASDSLGSCPLPAAT